MKVFFKIALTIFVLFICALLSSFIYVQSLPYWGRKEVPEMTIQKAQTLFDQAGGMTAINQQAQGVFNQIAASEDDKYFLFPGDLTNAPAISSLYSICKTDSGKNYTGTSMEVSTFGGRHIEIKFGNHFFLKWIYIFDTNSTITFICDSNWIQMASNIFVSK